MKAGKIVLALAAGSTLLAAAPAFADPPQWAPAHGWRAAPPAPVFYGRVPLGPGVQIGFRVRL